MSKKSFLMIALYMVSIIITFIVTSTIVAEKITKKGDIFYTEANMIDLSFFHKDLVKELEYVKLIDVFYAISKLSDTNEIDEYIGWCDNIEENYNETIIQRIEEHRELTQSKELTQNQKDNFLSGLIRLQKFCAENEK